MFKVIHDAFGLPQCTVIIKHNNIIYSGVLDIEHYKGKLIHTEHDLETILEHGFSKHSYDHFGMLRNGFLCSYVLTMNPITETEKEIKKLDCKLSVRSIMYPQGFVHNDIKFILDETKEYNNKIFKKIKKKRCCFVF